MGSCTWVEIPVAWTYTVSFRGLRLTVNAFWGLSTRRYAGTSFVPQKADGDCFARLTIDRLTRIFDQRFVAAEFEALVPFTGQDQALPEAREGLAAAVTERIEWLTKLQNDLDKFPESGRVTMGGHR